jgi:hypothetical protein
MKSGEWQKEGSLQTGSQDCVNAPVSPNRPLWSLIAFAGATLSTRLWHGQEESIVISVRGPN